MAERWPVGSLTSDPAEVIDIPRADSVAWTGRADGPPAGAGRPVAGNIALRLPPPMGWFTVREWSGTGSNVAAAGTDRYDLPGVVPAGVVFELRAEHYEGEELFCRGSAQLRIPGGPGPLAWVALALAVLLAAPLVLVGRGGGAGSGRRAGRAVGGALLGSLAGGVAGLVLVLFGVVPLASPVVTAAAAVGLLGGGAWAVWAPLGSGTPAGQPAGGAQ